MALATSQAQHGGGRRCRDSRPGKSPDSLEFHSALATRRVQRGLQRREMPPEQRQSAQGGRLRGLRPLQQGPAHVREGRPAMIIMITYPGVSVKKKVS